MSRRREKSAPEKKGCGGKESVGGAFVRWRLTGNSAAESEGKEEEEEEGEEVRRGEKSGKKRNGNLFAHTPFSSSLYCTSVGHRLTNSQTREESLVAVEIRTDGRML